MPARLITREVLIDEEPEKYKQAINILLNNVFRSENENAIQAESWEPEDVERLLIAENDRGLIAAAGVVSAINDREYELTLLCTLNRYRGQGIGSMVLSMLENLARENGAESLELTVASDNAAQFFENRGYLESDKITGLGMARSDYIKSLV